MTANGPSESKPATGRTGAGLGPPHAQYATQRGAARSGVRARRASAFHGRAAAAGGPSSDRRLPALRELRPREPGLLERRRHVVSPRGRAGHWPGGIQAARSRWPVLSGPEGGHDRTDDHVRRSQHPRQAAAVAAGPRGQGDCPPGHDLGAGEEARRVPGFRQLRIVAVGSALPDPQLADVHLHDPAGRSRSPGLLGDRIPAPHPRGLQRHPAGCRHGGLGDAPGRFRPVDGWHPQSAPRRACGTPLQGGRASGPPGGRRRDPLPGRARLRQHGL